MATILKNGKKWRAQIRRKGISKSKTFFTKAEAVNWARLIESQIEVGEYNAIPSIAFSDLIDKYLREQTILKGGARTERYRLLRISRSFLGKIMLPDLTKEHFRKWQNQRLQEVQPNSVIRERASLSAVLSKAIEWDFLKTNPLLTLEKPKAPPPRTRRYSDEEIERIVFVSGYDARYQPITVQNRVGAMFLFAIETAMRAGEIASLTWENVNFEKRTAYLPKTKNGYPRTLPLSSKAIAILQHLWLFKNDKNPTVFQVTAKKLDGTFRKLKRLANLHDADLHFHDTRREALTRLAKCLTVMELAKVSGHRDLSILQNTYYNPDISELVSKLD